MLKKQSGKMCCVDKEFLLLNDFFFVCLGVTLLKNTQIVYTGFGRDDDQRFSEI